MSTSAQQETGQQPRFDPSMSVDEAFRLHAGARRVFARFHLGGCSNCAISESHTIGAVSEDYAIPLPMLLESLNALFDQGAVPATTLRADEALPLLAIAVGASVVRTDERIAPADGVGAMLRYPPQQQQPARRPALAGLRRR